MSAVATQSNQTSQTNTPQTPQPEERTMADRFGSGRYFALQCEVFKDVKRLFNLTEEKAESLAKAVATNVGSAMARGQITFKGLDKLNKDGGIKSIAEISKVKNLPLTNEFAMLRALAYCNSAMSHHVQGVFSLDETLTDWVKGLK